MSFHVSWSDSTSNCSRQAEFAIVKKSPQFFLPSLVLTERRWPVGFSSVTSDAPRAFESFGVTRREEGGRREEEEKADCQHLWRETDLMESLLLLIDSPEGCESDNAWSRSTSLNCSKNSPRCSWQCSQGRWRVRQIEFPEGWRGDVEKRSTWQTKHLHTQREEIAFTGKWFEKA